MSSLVEVWVGASLLSMRPPNIADLTRDSFKKKVVRDRLRKVRLDKCWRFDIADLDAWIDGHKEQIAEETAA
jgi:hypothetical protein